MSETSVGPNQDGKSSRHLDTFNKLERHRVRVDIEYLLCVDEVKTTLFILLNFTRFMNLIMNRVSFTTIYKTRVIKDGSLCLECCFPAHYQPLIH